MSKPYLIAGPALCCTLCLTSAATVRLRQRIVIWDSSGRDRTHVTSGIECVFRRFVSDGPVVDCGNSREQLRSCVGNDAVRYLQDFIPWRSCCGRAGRRSS
jgi:hypothetical protein